MEYKGKTFSKKEIDVLNEVCKLSNNYNSKYFKSLNNITLDLKEKKEYTCILKESIYSKGYLSFYYTIENIKIIRETKDFYMLSNETRILKTRIYAIAYR